MDDDGGFVGGEDAGVGVEGFVVGAGRVAEVDDGVGVPVRHDEGFLGKGHESAIFGDGAGEDPGGFGENLVFVVLPDAGFGADAAGFAVGRGPFDEDVEGGAGGGPFADGGHGCAAFEADEEEGGLEVDGVEGEDEDGLVDLALGSAGEDFDGAFDLVDPAGGGNGFGDGVDADGAEDGDGTFPADGGGVGLGFGADRIDDGRRGCGGFAGAGRKRGAEGEGEGGCG